jgi:hypothetical protein
MVISKMMAILYYCMMLGESLLLTTKCTPRVTLQCLQVKEHVCSECGKAFGQKGDLVKHIKTIHEQVPLYPVLICGLECC